MMSKQAHELPIARTWHPAQWAVSAVVVVLVAILINLVLTNENFQWPVVWHYLYTVDILTGLLMTVELTVIAMVAGVIIGSLVAIMRLSKNPLLLSLSWLYIWFFRGTPLLVQIIFWFNISLLVPTVSIGVPFIGPEFFHASTNDLVTPFAAAVFALSLHEGAYMSEIVRAGLISVEADQLEAAHAIGMNKWKTLRLIVFPQAMRAIVPPTGNQVIGMLKTTSLVSVIALPELLYSAQLIYAVNFRTIPLLIVASIWYLVASTLLTYVQFYIERHYAKGASRTLPPTPLQRTRRKLRTFGRRVFPRMAINESSMA